VSVEVRHKSNRHCYARFESVELSLQLSGTVPANRLELELTERAKSVCLSRGKVD